MCLTETTPVSSSIINASKAEKLFCHSAILVTRFNMLTRRNRQYHTRWLLLLRVLKTILCPFTSYYVSVYMIEALYSYSDNLANSCLL